MLFAVAVVSNGSMIAVDGSDLTRQDCLPAFWLDAYLFLIRA